MHGSLQQTQLQCRHSGVLQLLVVGAAVFPVQILPLECVKACSRHLMSQSHCAAVH
jgi:hypothetical protein